MLALLFSVLQAIFGGLAIFTAKAFSQESLLSKAATIGAAATGVMGSMAGLHNHAKYRKIDAKTSLWIMSDRLADRLKVGPSSFSLHVYEKSFFSKTQKRIVSRRGAASLGSNKTWPVGKGAVGRCAQDQNTVFVQPGVEYESAVQLAKSGAKEWTKIDGLSLGEAEYSLRFAIIVAIPLISEHGDYRGCVTFDTTDPKAAKAMLSKGAREDALDLARTLVKLG